MWQFTIAPVIASGPPLMFKLRIDVESNRVVYIFGDTPITRQKLSEKLTRLSEVDKSARFAITPAPEVTHQTITDILDEASALRLTGAMLFIGSSNDTFKIISYSQQKPEKIQNDKAQQAGAGYPPQGVGSPDP